MDAVSQFLSTWDTSSENAVNHGNGSTGNNNNNNNNNKRNSAISMSSFTGKRKNSTTSTNSSNASGNAQQSSGSASGTVAGAGGTASGSGANNTAPTKSEPNFLSTFLSTKSTSSLNSQLTDKLVEKFILMALPTESGVNESNIQQRLIDAANRPQFSVQLMSKNFINMNSRLSIPFITLNNIFKLLNWENPSLNIFILLLITNLILTPLPILFSLPFFYLVYGIMLPQYLHKYSLDTINFKTLFGLGSFPYPSYYPTNVVEEAKPCSQFSKEFFINMTDLQNFLVIYIIFWDLVNNFLKRFIYFKVESVSNFAFLAVASFGVLNLTVMPYLVFYLLPVLKVALIVLVWGFLIMMHPNNRNQFFQMLDIENYIKQKVEEDEANVGAQQRNHEIQAGLEKNDAVTADDADIDSVTADNTAASQENEGEDEDEYSRFLEKEKRQKAALKEIIGKKIPNKRKIIADIKDLEQKFYLRFIKDEFEFKSYYLENVLDFNYLGNFDRNKLQEVRMIEIFEIQSFNKTDKEWNASLYSTDFFTKNSEIRKSYVNQLRLKRKIQLQNDHIDKTIKHQQSSSSQSHSQSQHHRHSSQQQQQPTASSSAYSLSSYLKGEVGLGTANENTTSTSAAAAAAAAASSVNQNERNTNSELSTLDNDTDELVSDTNVKPLHYSTSLKLISAPKNYEFSESSDWKLDLCPPNWCAKEHISDIVDIDDEGKWVYDINLKTKNRSNEFRRRRWTRLVVRSSDYNRAKYNGDENEVFEDENEDEDDEDDEEGEGDEENEDNYDDSEEEEEEEEEDQNGPKSKNQGTYSGGIAGQSGQAASHGAAEAAADGIDKQQATTTRLLFENSPSRASATGAEANEASEAGAAQGKTSGNQRQAPSIYHDSGNHSSNHSSNSSSSSSSKNNAAVIANQRNSVGSQLSAESHENTNTSNKSAAAKAQQRDSLGQSLGPGRPGHMRTSSSITRNIMSFLDQSFEAMNSSGTTTSGAKGNSDNNDDYDKKHR